MKIETDFKNKMKTEIRCKKKRKKEWIVRAGEEKNTQTIVTIVNTEMRK